MRPERRVVRRQLAVLVDEEELAAVGVLCRCWPSRRCRAGRSRPRGSRRRSGSRGRRCRCRSGRRTAGRRCPAGEAVAGRAVEVGEVRERPQAVDGAGRLRGVHLEGDRARRWSPASRRTCPWSRRPPSGAARPACAGLAGLRRRCTGRARRRGRRWRAGSAAAAAVGGGPRRRRTGSRRARRCRPRRATTATTVAMHRVALPAPGGRRSPAGRLPLGPLPGQLLLALAARHAGPPACCCARAGARAG